MSDSQDVSDCSPDDRSREELQRAHRKTEQRRQAAEERLRWSERFHRLAAQAGGVGTWHINLDTGTCHVSTQMATLMGHDDLPPDTAGEESPPDVQHPGVQQGEGLDPTAHQPLRIPLRWQQMPRAAWMASIHPADRPAVQAALTAAKGQGRALDLAFRVQVAQDSASRSGAGDADRASRSPPEGADPASRGEDQRIRWLHSYGRVLHERSGEDDSADATAYLLGASIDITERKALTRKLQNERDFIDRVLETVGTLVVVLAPSGQIIRFNKACEAASGYSAEEAEGQNVFELLIPPEDHEGVLDYFDRHVQGLETSFHENHWITKDGETRLLRWSVTTLRDDDGQVQHVIAAGTDITERRRLERQVLSAADEERRRLGQNLHDLLASQLAGIAMMTQSLAVRAEADESVSGQDLRTIVDLASESGDQARALSHSLMPMEGQSDGLADALRQLAERQETMAPSVQCVFELGAAITPCSIEEHSGAEQGQSVLPIHGDVAARLYRIAHEAVINAVQHGQPDAVTIRLEVVDDQLVLTVRDDGVGLPADLEPDDGWGLHLMQYRAELIGARLRAEPAETGGTLVRCALPLTRLTP
ncbi:MAG: PAS domain S-box protein [Bacteroidetes bacterium]|jgi:PAS domain S-box-containing protein|nr:PAS domain S-box protein [Bacteroidota bacterium]